MLVARRTHSIDNDDDASDLMIMLTAPLFNPAAAAAAVIISGDRDQSRPRRQSLAEVCEGMRARRAIASIAA